jgi:DNA-binding HxlR family transcriptional regulator
MSISNKTLLLLGNKLPSKKCMIAFKIVGDMPTLALVYFLNEGPKRFSELEKLTRINPSTMTSRLKHMHALGLVERKEQEADNQSVSYGLTSLGSKIVPIVQQIESFADQLPES